MDVMTTIRGEFTRAEWTSLPDDGRRYEVIDGVLIVSPSPALVHQRVVGALYRLLHSACPPHLEVFVAPLDVELSDPDPVRSGDQPRLTIIEPDLVVLRRADTAGQRVPSGVTPELAVEVLSPSSRAIDLHVKKERFRRAGVPAYWVVDPEDERIICWELVCGDYVERYAAHGDTPVGVTLPFPVEVRASDLVRG